MRFIETSSRLAVWGLLAFIVFVTVSPIDLRPATETTVNLDRALAFALVGFGFALGYPRHWRLLVFLLPTAAFAIEALQYLDPSRHPRLADAGVKALGAVAGMLVGRMVAGLARDRPAPRRS